MPICATDSAVHSNSRPWPNPSFKPPLAFERIRREALHDCLELLPTQHRELIESYYDGGAAVADLASRLGRTSDSLYKSLQRIRKSLFHCINRKVSMEVGS